RPPLDVAETVPPLSASRPYSSAAILRSYDPLADTARLRANPAAFESLRNNYALRPEVTE
ncbi:MAG: erythronate-4-phosphate dehydrogenase, partial [Muribaculaceae bacterium]